MNRSRLFDWRFVLAFAFLALVAYLIWAGVNTAAARDDSDDRADHAIALLAQEQQSSKLARIAATAERAVLIDKQNDLLDEVAELQRKQAALLDYLRTQGIAIPSSFNASSTARPSGGDAPKGHGKAKGHKKPKGSKRP